MTLYAALAPNHLLDWADVMDHLACELPVNSGAIVEDCALPAESANLCRYLMMPSARP